MSAPPGSGLHVAAEIVLAMSVLVMLAIGFAGKEEDGWGCLLFIVAFVLAAVSAALLGIPLVLHDSDG